MVVDSGSPVLLCGLPNRGDGHAGASDVQATSVAKLMWLFDLSLLC